jgi:hypothetical protein
VKEESSALSCCCARTTPDSKSFRKKNTEGDVSKGKATYQRVACFLWSQPRGQTADRGMHKQARVQQGIGRLAHIITQYPTLSLPLPNPVFREGTSCALLKLME